MVNRCILYVEDDENEAFLMRRAFEEAAISQPLHIVSDGHQAISFLAGAGRSGSGAANLLPCQILLDLHLPAMPGLGVLEWIRAQPALTTPPVIIISSSQDPQDVTRAYRLRADSYLVKPADLTKRLELAKFLKGWWLDYNQFPEAEQRNSHAGYAGA